MEENRYPQYDNIRDNGGYATRPIDNVRLTQCGILLSFLFLLIASLSVYFDPFARGVDRPLLQVIVLLLIAFPVYAWAWKLVGGFSRTNTVRTNTTTLVIVLLFGLAFRFIMVPTTPIQEIDIYRYIWDGAVVSQGGDPFLYSPQSVKNAINEAASGKADIISKLTVDEAAEITRLVDLSQSHPGANYALRQIHFGQFSSPYPPVSQAVFGTVLKLLPDDANSRTCLIAMKFALVVFDFGTVLVLISLLRYAGRSPALALVYWWCPLTLKEISNSGHLDSIVVFFSLLTIYLTVRAFFTRAGTPAKKPTNENLGAPVKPAGSSTGRFAIQWALACALSLAFAIAAKIIPIVIFPVWFCLALRRNVLGAIGITLVFAAATTCLVWPMARHMDATQRVVSPKAVPQIYGDTLSREQQGVEAFSKFWEMNDLIFMVFVENLKLDPKPADLASGQAQQKPAPWFRVTTNEFRKILLGGDGELPEQVGKLPPSYPHFATARKMTLVVFVVLVLLFCWNDFRVGSMESWLSAVFLSIAWFWLLAPTQNPWYWLWALPLIPFAKNRTWFYVSGLLMLYYLRFWYEYHYPGLEVMNSGYKGTQFFDFVVPWVEFFPILVGLVYGGIVGVLSRRKRHKPS